MIIYHEQRNYIVLEKVVSFMGKRENEHRVRRIGTWGWAYWTAVLTRVIRVCFTKKVVTEPRLKGGARVSQAENWRRRKHFRQMQQLGHKTLEQKHLWYVCRTKWWWLSWNKLSLEEGSGSQGSQGARSCIAMWVIIRDLAFTLRWEPLQEGWNVLCFKWVILAAVLTISVQISVRIWSKECQN